MEKKMIELSDKDYKELFNYSQTLCVILNTKFEILDANDLFIKIFDNTKLNLLGVKISDIYAKAFPDSATNLEKFYESLQSVLTTKNPNTLLLHCATTETWWKACNTPICRDDGSIKYIVHCLVDDTDIIKSKAEEEQAKDKLYEFSEMFNIMVSNNKSYAIFMVDLEGKITSWNNGAKLLTGFTSNEVLGKPFSIFFTPEDIANKAPEVEIYYAKINGHFATEQQIINKSGATFWCDSILDTIRNKEGILIGFCKIMRDLTENKRLEMMKDEFVSLVSHELRTPLTTIIGAIEIIIKSSNELPEKMKKLLKIAHDNTERLGKSINNILSLETLEYEKINIQFHKVAISQMLTEVIMENLDFANRLDIKIQYEPLPTNIFIHSNLALLKEATSHVLHNAIKFSPPKSTVLIRCLIEENLAEICISDEGEGVPEAFEKIIFQKFTQAQRTAIRQHGGLGLGLTISRQIIERLGGVLTYKNRRKKGTLFSIKLPLAPTLVYKNATNTHELSAL